MTKKMQFFCIFFALERVWKIIPAICTLRFVVYFVRIRLPQPATIEGRGAFTEDGLHMK